jgi:hypothetical protein
LGERLARAGAALERHFREMGPGGGAALLRHSYALMVGLAQMPGGVRATRRAGAAIAGSQASVWNYSESLDRALRDLWEGTIRRAAGAQRSGAV